MAKRKVILPQAFGLYKFEEEEKGKIMVNPYTVLLIVIGFVILELVLHLIFKIRF